MIAEGRKFVETRSWAPPRSLIGKRIAIHAGMYRGPVIKTHIAAFYNGLVARNCTPNSLAGYDPETGAFVRTFPLGAILATATLWDAIRVSRGADASWPIAYERPSRGGSDIWIHVEPNDYGDFSTGRWIWILEDARSLPGPITVRGKQGLWEWDAGRLFAI